VTRPNECLTCGAWRLDGKPPFIHERGCPNQPTVAEGIERWLDYLFGPDRAGRR
jgi:hypothetical protein